MEKIDLFQEVFEISYGDYDEFKRLLKEYRKKVNINLDDLFSRIRNDISDNMDLIAIFYEFVLEESKSQIEQYIQDFNLNDIYVYANSISTNLDSKPEIKDAYYDILRILRYLHLEYDGEIDILLDEGHDDYEKEYSQLMTDLDEICSDQEYAFAFINLHNVSEDGIENTILDLFKFIIDEIN